MLTKLLHLSFIIFIIGNSLYSQSNSLSKKTDTLKNQVFLEIFGNGIKYSINYERILTNRTKTNITTRLGFGYYPFNYQVLSIPVEVTAFWGGQRNFVEFGLGINLCSREMIFEGSCIDSCVNSKIQKDDILYTFRCGYRYQKPNGRSSLKVALTFLFESEDVNLLNPQVPIGISYGYRF